MKTLPVLSMLCLSFVTCGSDDIEENSTELTAIYPKSHAPIATWKLMERRTEITWHVGSAYCGPGWGPYLAFYDVTNGETWGPFEPGAFSGQMNIKVSCIIGSKVCYGAWFGQKAFYDCGDAEKTHTCVFVASNPEYLSWGCGLNCKHLASTRYPTCIDCSLGAETNVYLNCGN